MDLALLYRPVSRGLAEVQGNVRDLAHVAPHPLFGELLEHVLVTIGKGVRPGLTLLAAQFGKDGDFLAKKMAVAVELLHIATLVHDDTVDESSSRRGRPTVNSRWGEKIAVLVGDYLFASSATAVCDTGNVRVIRRFAETIMELSTGQLMEYMALGKSSVTRDEYMDRIYNKTGSLFRTATESGAILGGANEEAVQALTDYGRDLGMAFQIVDDLLDVVGDEKEVGKPVNNDILQGTLTLPAILLIERVPRNNPVVALLEGKEFQVNFDRALNMMRDSNILHEVYSIAAEFRERAINAISRLPECDARASLIQMAYYATERQK